jgi:pimeloyl-ACP methyl ester carboxylesterase
LDNANTWLPLFLELSGTELGNAYNWLALDFAGHGESDHRSPDAHYHHTDYVFDLYSLIRSQNWAEVTLLGHSMGGIVSSALAACMPEPIRQLLCIEAMGPLQEEEVSTVSQMQGAFTSRCQVYDKTVKQPRDWESLVKAKQKAGGLNEQHAGVLLERNVNLSHTGITWKTDARLRTQSTLRFTPAQAKHIMRGIQCPMTVVMGHDGFSRVAQQARSRASWVKDLNTLSLDGNHYVHMQQAEALSLILKKLLQP